MSRWNTSCCLALGVLALLLAGESTARAAKKEKIPSREELKKAVDLFFARRADYEPQGLILRSHVEELLEDFRRRGWKVPYARTILIRTVQDDEYLAEKLYTPRGRKFMRRVAKYDHAFDIMDRLIKIPDGKKILSRLIDEPGGSKLIKYMATDKGGKKLKKMLTRVPGGKNFMEPTGRIYTKEQLLEEPDKRFEKKRRAAKSRKMKNRFSRR